MASSTSSDCAGVSPHRLHVRDARAEDVPLLATIRNDATAYKLSRGDFVWGRSGWTVEAAQRTLDQGGLYVVEQDGIAAGMMSLSWQDDEYWGPREPNAGYLHGLSVRDGFRGLGLGNYAIDWSAEFVRAHNRDRLRLDCEVKNARLCAYYESLGFARVGMKPFPSGYIASLYERIIR
ncbi:GNAT family N-acetyltransferase [Burkholderia sp. Ac-20353]|uniref:GNAT family N-acetyltransferase n=1 Tax=Burkholderia sp. Ac-20353 TaxID=2703894 RepID=UPI00197B2E7A|nr:GNAT family N-acetyltransferase [Burkholderia sp. Ac-20353]MBN3787247.1 GNAT family N-acetyltransferase [Burkholderia sp. Ac-20353]